MKIISILVLSIFLSCQTYAAQAEDPYGIYMNKDRKPIVKNKNNSIFEDDTDLLTKEEREKREKAEAFKGATKVGFDESEAVPQSTAASF